MEVVTGIQPKMPVTLAHRLPVQEISVDAYVKDLIEYLVTTHEEVNKHAEKLRDDLNRGAIGGHGGVLEVGDIVIRRKNDKNKPQGTSRFETLSEPGLFRITKKLGANTYELEHLDGTPIVNPKGEATGVPADMLVKCDLPELEFDLDTHLPRRLEIQDSKDPTLWNKATLEKFGADGRTFIRFDGEPERRYIDLTQQVYRWLVPGQEEPRAVVKLS